MGVRQRESSPPGAKDQIQPKTELTLGLQRETNRLDERTATNGSLFTNLP